MEERRQARSALGDISNITTQTDNESLMREERNRKQREYRARKRDEETMEQREERNRKRREYYARKKAEETHVPSTTCQPSAFDGNKENEDEYECTDWLHRNDEYIRQLHASFMQMQPQTSNSVITNTGGSSCTPCHMSSLQSVLQHRPPLLPMQIESPNSIVINTAGASSTPKMVNRNWYINMDQSSKEKLLQQRRDYKKAKASAKLQQEGLTRAQEEIIDPMLTNAQQARCVEDNYIELDSALFQPAYQESDDEDCAFQSYRVNNGSSDSEPADDPFDFVYKDLPQSPLELKKVPDYQYCGVMKFDGEPPGFCCRKGKIKVHIHGVPSELKRLFTSQVHDDALYFRNHIRYFNSHFSFTSLGVTLDQRYATAAGTGIYTFRVHGAMYHRLDHLVPGSKGPRHLQLYFYDTDQDDTLSHRVKRSPDLDINLIRHVLLILQAVNPYVQTFNRAGAIPNIDEYAIELNTNVHLTNEGGETGWNQFMPYNDSPTISPSSDGNVQQELTEPAEDGESDIDL